MALYLQNEMVFMKIQQTLIPHFPKLQRKSAALHREVIRKLLSGKGNIKFIFIYSILYKPCIFKAYRLLNVQTLCIFPCFCPYEPKQGKFLFSADYLIQQSCGSTLRFPCSVSVNVHCGTDISVSEKFLHIFRCCTV